MEKNNSKVECLDNLRRLNFLPPYNKMTNISAFDGHFAKQIEREFDEELLKECKKELNV